MVTHAADTKKKGVGVDKGLLIIISATVLIVLLTLVVLLTRKEPAYMAEGTPDATVHNYLLALQLEDYGRAWSYLSPSMESYPDSADFEEQAADGFGWYWRDIHSSTFAIVESKSLPSGIERVTVRETVFRNDGPFDNSQYSSEFEMRLVEETAGWRLIESSRYWYDPEN